MVLATRQAFTALRANGNDEVPTNLRLLYRLPTRVVIGYWRRVLKSPRGEPWFGAHSRAAPEEMRDLADQLQEALLHTGHSTPDLKRLLATPLPGTNPPVEMQKATLPRLRHPRHCGLGAAPRVGDIRQPSIDGTHG